MAKTRFALSKVAVNKSEERSATWSFAGKTVRGKEHVYRVEDQNYSQRNNWEFVVRVPTSPTARVEVRPLRVPNKKVWAGLDRRSLTFNWASMPAHVGKSYCQVSVPKARGVKGTRTVLNRDQRGALPRWFQPLLRRMRRKETVRRTRGTDAHALVMLVRPRDHATMIRAFFASKVWTLASGFVAPET
jgi:hypothetical protein